MVIVQNVFIDTGHAESCFYQAFTLQGTATLFTINQQQIMTVRSYGNCSDFCPPHTVLSIDRNKKWNTTKNNQRSLLHCLSKGTFRTHCIIFEADFWENFLWFSLLVVL
jgi:hypothetical protein